jgi:hypothetical protein
MRATLRIATLAIGLASAFLVLAAAAEDTFPVPVRPYFGHSD